MPRFFNTAGPIKPDLHYYIPAFQRLDWDEIQMLIASQKYFLIHAPRQTGKTSALLEMAQALNDAGTYKALYVNVETAQVTRNDIARGMATICDSIGAHADVTGVEPTLQALARTVIAQTPAERALTQLLAQWSQMSDKPIVLFIDEADALVGDTLISLLRQIRAGYTQRPHAFPQSIVLCGLRDIKDYRIAHSNGDIITGGSAFNIKAESLRMGNFTEPEVIALYRQHTQETGQIFADTIFADVWADTAGQPWLVNALAYEMTWKDKAARDRSTTLTLAHYQAARERLIASRATHLDQLADKLLEPRVHRIISPMLSGDQTNLLLPHDDLQYCEDLGLIARKPHAHISNRIYREIIPRELTAVTQDTMIQQSSWYLTADHQLDMAKLLSAFQQFFRENSDSWIERFDYKEAGPQLLMQAFLQRIINGGGRLNREYALGRRRTDLMIEWPLDPECGFDGPVQRIVIELKIQRGDLQALITKGVAQTCAYADGFGAEQAHLVIFNRMPETTWDEKIWQRTVDSDTRQVVVWGC